VDTPAREKTFVNDETPVSRILRSLLRVLKHDVKDLNNLANRELGPGKGRWLWRLLNNKFLVRTRGE
jgi:hypothetical protein